MKNKIKQNNKKSDNRGKLFSEVANNIARKNRHR